MTLSEEKLDAIFRLLNPSSFEVSYSKLPDSRIINELVHVLHSSAFSEYLLKIIEERNDFFNFVESQNSSQNPLSMDSKIDQYVASEILDDFKVFDPLSLDETMKSNSFLTIKGRDINDDISAPQSAVENEIIYTCLNLIDLIYENEEFRKLNINLSELVKQEGSLGKYFNYADFPSLVKVCPRLKDDKFFSRMGQLPKRFSSKESCIQKKHVSVLRRLQIVLTSIDLKGDGCINVDLFRKYFDKFWNSEIDKHTLDAENSTNLERQHYDNFLRNLDKARRRFGITNKHRPRPHNISTAPKL